jgi:hypothetical protein
MDGCSLTRMQAGLNGFDTRKLPARRDRAEGEGEIEVAFSRVFTLEVDGKPTLAFEATGTRDAQQLCQESWLLNDLSILTSAGVRLRTVKSKLTVRAASPDEATIFRLVANAENPSDDMVIAYLVKLDGQEDRP